MQTVHTRLSLLAPALGLALVAVYAAGQTLPVQPQQKPHQPYTAEFKIMTVRTLANGTTITRESTEIHAVDRDGRVVTLTKQLPTNTDHPAATRGRLSDPVEGTDTDWDSLQGKTKIVKGPPADQHQGCWATETGERWQFGTTPQREATVKATAHAPAAWTRPVQENLGTMTIEGVEAQGTRATWKTPTGEIGNDAPLVRTEESWYTTSLHLLLRRVDDDPQSGKTTREVVSLSPTDPDPALFQPPEGYEVVTETAHPVACE